MHGQNQPPKLFGRIPDSKAQSTHIISCRISRSLRYVPQMMVVAILLGTGVFYPPDHGVRRGLIFSLHLAVWLGERYAMGKFV